MPIYISAYLFSYPACFLVRSIVDPSSQTIGSHQQKASVDQHWQDSQEKECQFPAMHKGKDNGETAGEGGTDEKGYFLSDCIFYCADIFSYFGG